MLHKVVPNMSLSLKLFINTCIFKAEKYKNVVATDVPITIQKKEVTLISGIKKSYVNPRDCVSLLTIKFGFE